MPYQAATKATCCFFVDFALHRIRRRRKKRLTLSREQFARTSTLKSNTRDSEEERLRGEISDVEHKRTPLNYRGPRISGVEGGGAACVKLCGGIGVLFEVRSRLIFVLCGPKNFKFLHSLLPWVDILVVPGSAFVLNMFPFTCRRWGQNFEFLRSLSSGSCDTVSYKHCMRFAQNFSAAFR